MKRPRGTHRVTLGAWPERKVESPEERAVRFGPLVSQGVRSQGAPPSQAKSPDELIRRGRRGEGPGGWTPI